MKTEIIVRTQFVDFHRYENAPEQVAFLRARHRHLFHVTLKIEVFHDDRELEYFIVKDSLIDFINRQIIPMNEKKSCEMMAEKIAEWASNEWRDHKNQGRRAVSVEVSEDGENGSIVTLGA